MIEVKRVEIRDRATTIPAVALKVVAGATDDRLLERAGFRGEYVLLIHLERELVRWDWHEWPPNVGRSAPQAHRWLRDNWDRHRDGGVVDVEYILGETTTPKESEVAP